MVCGRTGSWTPPGFLLSSNTLPGLLRRRSASPTGALNLDFNVSKQFTFSERFNAQFRAEFFNALNHANFGVPGVTIGAGFGQIVSTSGARIIQFALKLRF